MKILPVILFLASLCFAQTAQPHTPSEVPVDKEPHHHLVFENEYVRVFKVEVPPHESTLVHRHSRDYVVVTIGDAEVTNAVTGKEPKRWNFKDGEVTFLEAAGEKSFAHKAVNEAGTPFVNLTIEIKRSWNSPMRRCEEPQNCRRPIRVGGQQIGTSTSLFTNGFVSAYRYELQPRGTISSNFYAPGKNFVLLAALTDLEGNFGGIEQELKATQLFASDGADMEITAPRDQTLRWVVLRLTWR